MQTRQRLRLPVKPHRLPHLIFSFFYRSVYSFALLLLLALLAVTPADHVFQTLSNERYGNVVVVSTTVAVTALVALFIYASRLYTNRSVLAAIPHPYLPIEKGEVPNKVRREIVKGRQRASLIAWETRPRDLTKETEQLHADRKLVDDNIHRLQTLHEDAGKDKKQRFSHLKALLKHSRRRQQQQRRHAAHQRESSLTATPPQHKLHKPQPPQQHRTIHPILSFPPSDPPWGIISHAGWSAPSATTTIATDATADPDQPEPQLVPMTTVIAELPHLLEATAVSSLAPPDPAFRFLGPRTRARLDAGVPPDPRAVALLQRPRACGLRDYLRRLQSLGALADHHEVHVEEFLERYEAARFSTDQLFEREFDLLIDCFAAVLDAFTPLSADTWERLLQDDGRYDEIEDEDEVQEEEDDDTGSVRHIERPPASSSTSAASVDSFESSASVVHHHHHPHRDSRT